MISLGKLLHDGLVASLLQAEVVFFFLFTHGWKRCCITGSRFAPRASIPLWAKLEPGVLYNSPVGVARS